MSLWNAWFTPGYTVIVYGAPDFLSSCSICIVLLVMRVSISAYTPDTAAFVLASSA